MSVPFPPHPCQHFVVACFLDDSYSVFSSLVCNLIGLFREGNRKIIRETVRDWKRSWGKGLLYRTGVERCDQCTCMNQNITESSITLCLLNILKTPPLPSFWGDCNVKDFVYKIGMLQRLKKKRQIIEMERDGLLTVGAKEK
jgi:hypothetical protein